MSMTKRYLESLPQEEQDAILGRFDEWTDDAENEPSYADLAGMAETLMGTSEPTEAELAEWARTLTEAEQNKILGPPGSWLDAQYETVPQIFCKPDETDSAENEPDELTQEEANDLMGQRVEAEREWAQALMEDDDESNDPPVKCRICWKIWPISTMNTNGECPACQRETALLVKPEGKCVTLADNNGVEWKL